MSSTDRSTSTKLFHEKLSIFLQKEYTKKPNADLCSEKLNFRARFRADKFYIIAPGPARFRALIVFL
ncbi:hypothetical protein Mgra_00002926 [Meloidogyne graminicola]|uniref:Uncharacterized protein n=1 Tax=Meloidogyne graminicola TaxID=189291 RepID=A0A8S9ZWI8_9BILA|nr:hypothetical protein Mgra_00002926 [Meloidogyne graminicola]